MSVARRYTERALRLIQYGNEQSARVRQELEKLAGELRRELAQAESAKTRRELNALLRSMETAIKTRFSAIAEQQMGQMADFAVIEAQWAMLASDFTRAPKPKLLAQVPEHLNVFGEPLPEAWEAQGDNLARKTSALARQVSAGHMLAAAAITQLGGLLNKATRDADALVHTTVAQATVDARMPVWKANGVNAFRFHAVLDSRTTPECAIRHGLVYDLETLAPIGHSIVLDREPPRHYRCRSIMLPVAYGPDIPMPEDGGQSTFREYFDSLSEEEQNNLFGPTRADMFRRGRITQADLVGQHGQRLTLVEITRDLPPDERAKVWMGDAAYSKHAAALTEHMRAMGAQHGLTEADMVVIRHYTSSAYLAFNESLRKGRVGIHSIGAEMLNSALNKLPPHRGIVIRRVDLFPDDLALHVPGNVVTYHAFTSTTTNQHQDVMKKKPHRLIIESLTGRGISTWSEAEWQNEVLFGAPRRFLVRDRRIIGSTVEMGLLELPDD